MQGAMHCHSLPQWPPPLESRKEDLLGINPDNYTTFSQQVEEPNGFEGLSHIQNHKFLNHENLQQDKAQLRAWPYIIFYIEIYTITWNYSTACTITQTHLRYYSKRVKERKFPMRI